MIRKWLHSASSINLGQIGGALIGGVSGTKYGPKLTIILASIPIILGWVLVSVSTNIYLLIAGNHYFFLLDFVTCLQCSNWIFWNQFSKTKFEPTFNTDLELKESYFNNDFYWLTNTSLDSIPKVLSDQSTKQEKDFYWISTKGYNFVTNLFDKRSSVERYRWVYSDRQLYTSGGSIQLTIKEGTFSLTVSSHDWVR